MSTFQLEGVDLHQPQTVQRYQGPHNLGRLRRENEYEWKAANVRTVSKESIQHRQQHWRPYTYQHM